MTPIKLRCELLTNPLGIDVRRPGLSWVLESSSKNQKQGAYRILVATTPEKLAKGKGDLWDSGKVKTDESLHIKYEGSELESRAWAYWKVKVWDATGKEGQWSEVAYWHMGIFTPGWQRMFCWDQPHTSYDRTLWIGEAEGQIISDQQAPPAVYLRRDFQVKGKVKRAVLYATALGLYEARLNGQRVGENILAPEWTDYRRRVQYQTYDVSALVKSGANCIGAILGAGWFAGRIGHCQGRYNYGHRCRFFARLYIETTSGHLEYVHTDGDWKVNSQGPILSNDLFDGEAYDARKEWVGWDCAAFNDRKWKKVWDIKGTEVWPDIGPLVSQMNEPIRVSYEFKPLTITEPKPGVYVLDMGQNMVGWVRSLFRKTKSGQKITLRHAEMLNPDGSIYFANMRGASPIDIYICKGASEETYEPRFTYHGFRYVEITGLRFKPRPEDFTGRVFHSDMPKTGTLETSSELMNKIFHATQWTQYGNMQSTPTDCPQRDERLGWMGDIQVFSQTAILNMDMAAFFRKFMQDVCDAQTSDGRFPDFAPHACAPEGRFTANPGWADAGVIIPWRQWINYGDRVLLEKHFESMKRWINYVDSISPDHLWQDFSECTPLTYGDWLNSDTFINLGGQSGFPKGMGLLDKVFYATAFFAFSTRLLSQMAKILGHKTDEKKYGFLATQITRSFQKNFLKPDGKLHVKLPKEKQIEGQNAAQPKRGRADVQAGYALALNFGLIPKEMEPKSAKQLVAALKPFNGHMSTGIQTTLRLMLELSRFGYHKEAYELISKTTIPSWGYMIENGATTIWERWDGYDKERGFQDPGMNSFNHYAIGAVGEWMYRVIGGICPDEKSPAWKHFFIQPVPGGGLTHASCTYESIRGTIRTEWKILGDKFLLHIHVPANCSATLSLPGKKRKKMKVGSGDWDFEDNL